MRADDEFPVSVAGVAGSRWHFAAAVTLHKAVSPNFSVPPFLSRGAQ
jgi:hypothetical protein